PQRREPARQRARPGVRQGFGGFLAAAAPRQTRQCPPRQRHPTTQPSGGDVLPVLVVAREELIAAIAGERDRDLLAGLAWDQMGWHDGSVADRFRSQRENVFKLGQQGFLTDHDFLMVDPTMPGTAT